MSVCLNCLREFKVRKGSQGKFCSHQCFCAYEHANKSHNCMSPSRINSSGKAKTKWLKKNLGEVIDESQEDYRIESKAVESIIFNPHITTATHQKLEELLKGLKKYRIENGMI